ncbi:unnamed protein product, partial [Closterium sp. Naga37s-1]
MPPSSISRAITSDGSTKHYCRPPPSSARPCFHARHRRQTLPSSRRIAATVRDDPATCDRHLRARPSRCSPRPCRSRRSQRLLPSTLRAAGAVRASPVTGTACPHWSPSASTPATVAPASATVAPPHPRPSPPHPRPSPPHPRPSPAHPRPSPALPLPYDTRLPGAVPPPAPPRRRRSRRPRQQEPSSATHSTRKTCPHSHLPLPVAALSHPVSYPHPSLLLWLHPPSSCGCTLPPTSSPRFLSLTPAPIPSSPCG